MVRKLDHYLFAFICLHVAIWTLAPSFIRFALPLDSMEGTTWGHQFEWGYDKNPFLSAWLTGLAIKLSHHSEWIIYFVSQLSVAICFWALWQLGKKILPPVFAFLSVLLLEGVQYYNFHAIDLSDNTLELGFWSLTILFFYQATRVKTAYYWILTGLFAGLSMMTKYYSIMLLLPMLGYLILDKNSRQNFNKPPMYMGLCVFLIIIAPHTIWLFSHDFITVNYAFDRVSNPPSWQAHFYFPGKFTLQIIQTFMPACILFSMLIFAKPFSSINDHEENIVSIRPSDQLFLLLIGLGPFALTLLLSALTGIKLRSGWGQPLLSLWGLLLFAYLRPTISLKQFNRFIIILLTIMIASVIGYGIALVRADGPSSANYPSKAIAKKLTEDWHEKFNAPIPYVAGTRWLAGNVSFYSKDNPAVFIDWNKNISPWIDEKQLNKKGGIFVWDLTEKVNIPFAEIKKQYPRITQPKLMEFAWLRNKRNLRPITIAVAYLPPA